MPPMRRKSGIRSEKVGKVVSKIIARSRLSSSGTTRQSIALMYLASRIMPTPDGMRQNEA